MSTHNRYDLEICPSKNQLAYYEGDKWENNIVY